MYLTRFRRVLRKLFSRALVVTLTVLFFSSCQHLGYYVHATGGQLGLLWDRQPIDSLLATPDLDPALGDKLRLIKDARVFAADELDLPVDDAYATYVALPRQHVVWNLQAAGEFSTRSHKWCFPVAGCVAYKGYFDESLARNAAAEMSAAGFDVYVRGVNAYSTLGWFEDPVLSSFIHYPDHAIVALLFHELAHRKLYVAGDTGFNESWATAVEIMATERWSASGRSAVSQELALRQLKATEYVSELIADTLKQLDEVYRQPALGVQEKRILKQQILDGLQSRYQGLEAAHGYPLGYAGFFSQPLNNAALLSVGHYTMWVPAFLWKYQQLDSDLSQFYTWSEAFIELEKPERDAILMALDKASQSAT